jgi:hypothetical protein
MAGTPVLSCVSEFLGREQCDREIDEEGDRDGAAQDQLEHRDAL